MLLKELTLDLLLLLILLLVILLLLVVKQALLLLHEELLMLLLLLKLISLLLLKVLVLQGTLSGHVRGASGQVSGGWSRRLKKRLDRATSGVGRLHQVGGLAGGCLRRAVGCREKNGRGRPVFGLVARASFTSVGGFLLWYIGRAEVLEEGSHFGLSDSVILIACTLLGHLQNRVAVSVCNYSVPLISLVPSEVPSIPVEVSGNLHGGRREAIPDRCVTNLSSGQKLLDLNHRVPFVEG